MFLKFRVKAALAKFITTNHCFSGRILPFFGSVLDDFMPYITSRGFDANQGAMAVITGTIYELRKDRRLWAELVKNDPELYQELT